MDWLALLGQLGGSYMGYKGSQEAADKAADATRYAADKSSKYLKGAAKQARADMAPWRQMGYSAIPSMQAMDITRGGRHYQTLLDELSQNFQFDPENPLYKQKQGEMTENINASLAARGMYNSRPGLNLLEEAGTGLMNTESERQYQQKYGSLMDLYNMSNQLSGTEWGRLTDMAKIGTGAAGQSGQAAMQAGQGLSSIYGQQGANLANIYGQQGRDTADFWSSMGTMPLNYMLLNKMFGNQKGNWIGDAAG